MITCSSGWIRAATVGFALLSLGATAQAQTSPPSPAAVALAREIINLNGIAKLYDPVVSRIVLRAKGALLQSNPMLSKDLDEVAQQVNGEFQARLDAPRQRTATLYASHFTEQELKNALAFFKSPLGAKVLTVEPKVIGESMAYGEKWAADLVEEILARMRAEMRKRGHEL